MSSKTKLKAGDAVITNDKYAKIIGNAKPHRGVLVKQTGWQADVWLIDMVGFVKPQRVHESLLTKEGK